ncbi:MAG: hypothetical protein ACE5HW_01820 [Candidatus Methanofastidiosia archaeon]
MKRQETVMHLELNAEQEKLLENPNYGRIITILRKGELNAKEIHKFFNKDYEDKKTLTSIYRYLEKLLENDLVFVIKEELKRKHLIEKYYSRTAKFFFFPKKRFEKKVVNATFELLQKIYNLDEERGRELKKLIDEHGKNLHKCDSDFFKEHGEKILKLEEKYGFKAVMYAGKTIIELLYFREKPELLERIFMILEG